MPLVPNPGAKKKDFYNRQFYIDQTKKQGGSTSPSPGRIPRTLFMLCRADGIIPAAVEEDGDDEDFTPGRGKALVLVQAGKKIRNGKEKFVVLNLSLSDIDDGKLLAVIKWFEEYIIIFELCD